MREQKSLPARGGFVVKKLCCGWIHAHSLLGLAKPLELHNSVYQCEEGIVAPDPNVASGMEFCSPLANQNTARRDELTAEPLDAQALRVAIPTVS